MKLIIAGGREFKDYELLRKITAGIDIKISAVICGMADGADLLGKRWAEENSIPVIECPADWNKFGKSAGPIRNNQMLEIADGLLAFWDGESRGTNHVIQGAKKRGIWNMVVRY